MTTTVGIANYTLYPDTFNNTGVYNGTIYGYMESFKYTMVIDFYVVPAVSILGIITNVLTFLVLIRSPLNNFSPSVYLAAYCLSSALTCFMIYGLGSLFHINNWPDLDMRSDSSCRIWSFVKKIILGSPNWFLVGAAIDRLIAVWLPKKANNICTVFVSKVQVCLTVVFLTTITVHEMWSNSLYYDPVKTCNINKNSFYENIGNVTRASVLFFLPTFLLFFLGNILVIRLCLKHHGRQIPNTASLDLDFTYVITVHSLLTFALNSPWIILNISFFIKYDQDLTLLFQILHYVSILVNLPIFFVLLVQCGDFREMLGLLLRSNPFCCSTRSSSIELRLMNEYNQVPSASTCV